MLTKYSVLMMLLIVTASLVGISSIYQPANVETQPQPQQQQKQLVPPSQIQRQPPIVTQQQPQSSTGKLITQQQAETLAQSSSDNLLLNRLFPQIIKRIDGNTILQKIDARTLAAKVLPYLDISASVSPRQGTPSILNVNDIARDLGLTGAEARGSTAKCNDGEIAVSGGFSFQSDPEDSYVTADSLSQENGWYSGALMGDNGKIQAFVTCLTINVALKDAQQPQQPQQQPSPPPGGPPLQSPSGPIVR